jgi:hypothetical protein
MTPVCDALRDCFEQEAIEAAWVQNDDMIVGNGDWST